MMAFHGLPARVLLAWLVMALGGVPLMGQDPLPTGHRTTISLGDIPWKFTREDPYPQAKDVAFDDRAWSTVGIPHCFNDRDTYLNIRRGHDKPFQGTVWYRTHFTLDPRFRDRKVYIEFDGVNIAAAVYINGTFIPGSSKIPHPEATHVHGFIGFVVDATNLVHVGSEDNILAVRVANGKAPWYIDPEFGTRFMFSMGMGGIFRPVRLVITDRTHIPLNTYAVVERWGTQVGTVAANEQSAAIAIATNIVNDLPAPRTVELITAIQDPEHREVARQTSSVTLAAASSQVVKHQATIAHPRLWYPAWSPYGKPVLYTVVHTLRVDGVVIDAVTSPLGIRTITWNEHYPLINGQVHQLWGFGQRYEYPGLGSAVPEEQQWRDIRLMTEAGGRFVRPGHCASSPATVAACDAYGVMMAQPSGDNEYYFEKNPSKNALILKKELHRDLLIRDRNHPSILLWEDDNGCSIPGLVRDLVAITEEWDSIHPRMNSPRDRHGKYQGDLIPGKTVLGQVNAGRPQVVPTWNAEDWTIRDARHNWAGEKTYAEKFIAKWLEGRDRGKIFAYAQWYLAETQGEDCTTIVGVDDPAFKAAMELDLAKSGKAVVPGRSLGCSAMDGNRLPKLLYRIWRDALWIPFEQRPGVALQSHWNLAGTVNVDAWSNCPQVELFLNGVSKGVVTPDPQTRRCTWPKIPWESGILKAEGKDAAGQTVCHDQRETAGKPHHLILSVEPPLRRPDGATYRITANGSDAGFVLATVVDAQGRWCPLADHLITFAVQGPGDYCGSYNFWSTPGMPLGYHAPGDTELRAEGGLMRIAVRSTFTPGTITVSATAPGLTSAMTSFTTVVPGAP